MNKYEIMFIVKNTIEDDKVKKVAKKAKKNFKQEKNLPI